MIEIPDPASPILIFSGSRKVIYLLDRLSKKVLFSFPAHNQTEKPEGDSLIFGSWGPAPAGFLTLSPPDFISHEFLNQFCREYFGNSIVFPGESLVQEWGEFEREGMGPVRFALGSPDSPEDFIDRIVWDRELLIHGGRSFEVPTRGCIRMNDSDLEKLAYQWISWSRMGYPLKVLYIANTISQSMRISI